jgi:alkylation response protein AidB-like acyl-CoA dehydrogenase
MQVGCRYTAVSDVESRERGDRLVAWLRDWAERRVDSRLMDERRSIPPNIGMDLGRKGVFGMQVEERWGGLALRIREVARVLEQAAAIDLGLGTWLLTSLFPGVRPIATFATDELKSQVLPLLASGRMLAGYAQTEPSAGTHFPAMAAQATAQPGGGWSVSGDKVWIGNAQWAGVLSVMAHEVGTDGRRHGLTALAVDVDAPGVELGGELLSIGMRGMVQGEVSFRDVAVAPHQLLGEREKGLEVGVDSMCWSRFAIAATCIGGMKRAGQLMLRFASRRHIATGRLVDHPVLRATFGETAAQALVTEALLHRVAAILDSGRGVSVDLFAVCKIVGSEFAWQAADRLVQGLGSRGYDEANGAGQLLRDARVTRIFEGTSEALLAYVGQQALVERSDIYAFLRDDLRADAVADRLLDAVRTMRKRRGVAGAGAEAEPPRPWLVAVAGRAAVAALLSAVADAEAASSGSRPGAARAAEWAAAAFADACARASSGSTLERAIVDPAEAEAIVATWTESIGDVEQRQPGERRGLDPLLRRSPTP